MQRLADLTTRFSQNVLADESGFHLVLESEADLAGPARFRSRRGTPGGCRSRHRRGRGDHAVALAHRSLPHVLRAARPAREGLARLDLARRASGRQRQPRSRRRDPRPAPRAGAPARLRIVCRLRAGRHHGRQPGGGDLAAACRCGSRRRRAPCSSARRSKRWPQRAARRRRSKPGTGASMPRRFAGNASISTKPRSSPTSRSSASPRPPSTAPVACSASASWPGRKSSSTTPTSRSTRCKARTGRRSAFSCTTTSRGRASAAAPG